jgi:competence protein ComEA
MPPHRNRSRDPPARNPPDEAFVEQSSTPWRVFDASAARGAVDGGAPSAGASSRAGPASALAGNQRAAIAGVLGAIAIGALAVVVAVTGAGGATVAGPEALAAVASGEPAGAAGQIVVDIAGAVVRPGVYRLGTGARVGDAIEAAGGFSPRVDVGRVGAELNLAATLADGAQVRVPSRDDPAPTGGAGGGAGGASGSQLVNLNTATESELDALSGIGPVTAGKIIESRAEAPFRSVDELHERGLVGAKTFEKIRARLTVG